MAVRATFGRRALARAVAVASVGLAGTARAQSHTAGAPQLSSKPGAAYTVYLDLSGFNYTGQWGGSTPGVTPAFDNAVNTFSAGQRDYITQVWAGIAEQYAVFGNVNVTTVDPAPAGYTDAQRQSYYDQRSMLMHTVVGDNNWVVAGGISFVGVTPYSQSNNGYHTNWVFPNYTGGEYALHGEVGATAHENGHGFGLNHQVDYDFGTGQEVSDYSSNNNAGGNGSFAPIMGVTYGAQRSLWRVGTVSDGSTQNDVGRIMQDPGMTGYATDAAGHSTAAAAALPAAGNQVDFARAKGVITPASTSNPAAIGVANYTSDYYKFTSAGGAVSLVLHDGSEARQLGVADAEAMFRGTLQILDLSGNVVATAASSADTLSSTVSQTLPAGTYYARVQSTGGYTGTYQAPSGAVSTTTFFDAGSYFLTGSGISSTNATTYFWAGTASTNKWTQLDAAASNWRTDHVAGAADPGAAPGGNTNVVFTADSAATLTSTLGGYVTVNSLTFTGTGTPAANGPVTVAADGYSLSLNALYGITDPAGGGHNAGTGLLVMAGAAADTIAAPVSLVSSQTWEVDNAAGSPLTVTGIVAGANKTLAKTGPGSLVLTAANSFSGGVNVSGGTLTFSAGSLGTGPVLLANGGTLQYAPGVTTDLTAGRTFTLFVDGGAIDTNGNNVTFAGNVAGNVAGPLTKAGTGTLTLAGTAAPSHLFVRTGAVVVTGTVTTAGTSATANNNYSSVGQYAGDNGTLVLAGTGTFTAAGELNVADVNAVGRMNLSAGTTVNARTLYVGKFAAASGTVNMTGGTLQEADNGAGPGDWRIGGGTGTGDAASVGLVNLAGGSFNAGSANLQVGAFGTGTVNQSGGTLNTNAYLSVGRFAGGVGNYNLSGGSLTALGLPRALVGEQGTGTLRVAGTGVATFNGLAVGYADGAAGTVVQTGGTVNAPAVLFNPSTTGGAAATGTYNLAGGTLNTALIQGAARYNSTSSLLLNGGTVVATANGSLGAGLTTATVGAGGATINPAAYALTVDQPLLHDATLGATKDGGITKAGPGTVTFNQKSTYSGDTTVGGGTVVVGADAALGIGTVNLGPATLTLQGVAAAAPSIANFANLTLNRTGTSNPATVANNVLRLTDGNGNEANSAFYAAAQTLNAVGFVANFTYYATGGADGIAFVVQNDPRGASAVGDAGGSFGYSNGNGGTLVANSGAVEFNIYAGKPTGTSFGTNGSLPASLSTGPVNVTAAHPLGVSVLYNAAAQTLTETVADATAGTSFTQVYPNVNFASLLGGTTGYVGFTGGTGGQAATQNVSNFTFAPARLAPVSIANPVAVTSAAAVVDVPVIAGVTSAAVGAVSVSAGSKLTLTTAGGTAGRIATLSMPSLSLAGTTGAWTGAVDLGANSLDVTGGDLSTLTDEARQGYLSGWAGTGGLLSRAAAADARHLTAVGVVANRVGTSAVLYGSVVPFNGVAPGAADVLVKYTYYGDANLDGVVNGLDYGRIDVGYAAAATASPMTGWYNGDFNYDGRVDGSDYSLVDNAFNLQAGSLSPSTSAVVGVPQADVAPTPATLAVPEPVAALPATLACLLGGRRRRPRRRLS